MTRSMSLPLGVRGRDVAVLTAGLLTTAVTVVGVRLLPVSATTAALALLLVVLATSTFGRLWIATVVALAATLALNFFFLPPVGTFTIADPQNWVALFAFLVDGRHRQQSLCGGSGTRQRCDRPPQRGHPPLRPDAGCAAHDGDGGRHRRAGPPRGPTISSSRAWRFACPAITAGASIRAAAMKCA